MKAILVKDWDKLIAPGTFLYTYHNNQLYGLIARCPCGCGKDLGISFDKWQYDGDRENPTVTPSIRRIGGCGWHGFLTKGIWKNA